MAKLKLSRWVSAGAAGALLAGGLAGCGTAPSSASGTSSQPGKPFAGQTITVAFFMTPPPADLQMFTKQTGIHVKWETLGWDTLQTKIAAAMTSHSYFADVADVDWSRVGEYQRLHWFVPLNNYFNIHHLASDVPVLSSFVDHGQLIAMPVDSSFMVTTVNTEDFGKAGIQTMPTTINQYTQDLKQLQAKGVSKTPLDIPFAAAEGLSTYWYQTTAAFGGTLLSANFKPLFTNPSSAGYKALDWMIGAYKSGLVPSANINMFDYQGMEQEMALNKVASVYADYSGQVGTIYDVPGSSTVIGKVQYIPTPGVNGIGPNVANPDGMGIPVTAKHVGAAVEFLKWFDNTKNQALWAGLDGNKYLIPTYSDPMRISSMELLVKDGKIPQGQMLLQLLKDHSRPIFPNGAPPWYPQFSNAVYTNIHSAAQGQESVAQAIDSIASTVNSLRSAQ